MKYLLLIVGLYAIAGCQSPLTTQDYHVVYKNDKEGNTVSGSKSELINYIRAGASIKVGWGVKTEKHSIEHIAEPIWIAVLDESEVIAHLDPQVLSKTDWTTLSANYADSSLLRQEWRVALTTKGSFDAVWIDQVNRKVTQRRPQNHTMTWFVKGTVRKVDPLFFTDPL